MSTKYVKENLDVRHGIGSLTKDAIKEHVSDFIIDSGPTAHGRWEKWASGKLVQKGIAIVGTKNLTTTDGFLSSLNNPLGDFPIPFVGVPSIMCTYERGTHASQGFHVWGSQTSTSIGAGDIYGGRTPLSSGIFIYEATGEWK